MGVRDEEFPAPTWYPAVENAMCCRHMTRREFCAATAMGVAGGVLALPSGLTGGQAGPIEPWDPDKPFLVTGKPLRVQPVLIHARYGRREKTSWRSWSRIIDDQAAAEEITAEYEAGA